MGPFLRICKFSDSDLIYYWFFIKYDNKKAPVG